MARCGRCRVVTVPDNQAWCADCGENDNPNNYVGGVHISQVELPDTDPWGSSMPADDFDLDAILNRASADTLRELEATTDLEARFAAITGSDTRTDDEVLRDIRADGDLILNRTLDLADAETRRLAAEPNIRTFEKSQRRRKTLRRLAFMAALAVVALLAAVTISRL